MGRRRSRPCDLDGRGAAHEATGERLGQHDERECAVEDLHFGLDPQNTPTVGNDKATVRDGLPMEAQALIHADGVMNSPVASTSDSPSGSEILPSAQVLRPSVRVYSAVATSGVPYGTGLR